MTTITEAFHLPCPDDVRVIGFVVKLRELSNEAQQLAHDYVVTPAVKEELPCILDDMNQVFDPGKEYRRFSFGSGKSHFVTMLSLLVKSAVSAWRRFHPLLNAHRDTRRACAPRQRTTRAG